MVIPALVVGAGLVLLSASRPWVEVVVEVTDGLPRTTLAGTGNSVGPVSALALVCLAAAGGLLAARARLRRVVAGVVSAAGVTLVILALRGMDAAGSGAEVARNAGDGAGVTEAAGTAWPVTAFVGGLLVSAAGLAALRFSARWPGMGARFDRDAGPVMVLDPWVSLDRGRDPTVDP